MPTMTIAALPAAAGVPRLGRPRPATAPSQLFNAHAARTRRRSVDLYDMDRNGVVTDARPDRRPGDAPKRPTGISTPTATSPTTSATRTPTASRTTTRRIGPLSAGWWTACYSDREAVPDQVRRHQGRSTPTATATASSTAPTTRTSTTCRTSWSSAATWPATCRSRASADDSATPATLRPAIRRTRRCVNPFNPCLPDAHSRTCPRHPAIGAPTRRSIADWKPYVLN